MFVMRVGDDFAKIEYIVKNNCYHLVHSEVPNRLRGKGIGRELVEKTFEYLHFNQIKAIAECSYIIAVAKRSEKLKLLI
jgi:predicted GNAT family acetyltransferase